MTALTSSQLFAELSDQQTEMIRGGDRKLETDLGIIKGPSKEVFKNLNVNAGPGNNAGLGNNEGFVPGEPDRVGDVQNPKWGADGEVELRPA